MSEIETTIDGIPCIVQYNITGGYYPATLESPPEYPDIELEILDRKGYPAAWLARKLTDNEIIRIEDECFKDAKEL